MKLDEPMSNFGIRAAFIATVIAMLAIFGLILRQSSSITSLEADVVRLARQVNQRLEFDQLQENNYVEAWTAHLKHNHGPSFGQPLNGAFLLDTYLTTNRIPSSEEMAVQITPAVLIYRPATTNITTNYVIGFAGKPGRITLNTP